ncbi:hypothetical protein L6164_012168 [Bauhinia variegata]|uniref:Uncharacterized protein n=1 Tax=Bauhinia variegata TaxID=167791 RepID=A0ACB9P998_BAUVA|nr:hypothetical protein L6164_012168 [Bauhinia variegata]
MKPLKPKIFSMSHVYSQFLLLFSLSLISLLPIPTTRAQTNQTDKMALLKFKESITNDPHGVVGSWNDSTHFCSWVGVTCGRKHQRVTALKLEGTDLGGPISPFIGNLSFLRSIMLRNNSLSGHIPQEVGRLFRLQLFLLWNNTLSGEIPTSLGNCSQLRIIDLSANLLTGPIPMEFGSLINLQELYLERNILTGGLPTSLGNISWLVIFSVAINSLEGAIPHEIGHLERLSMFEIGLNNLSGIIPYSLYNISSMTILSIPANQLSGNLPRYIGITLSKLQFLEYGLNKLSGSIPESLSNISGLQTIDLAGNNFMGSVPTNLGNLRELSILGLGHNNLGHNSQKDWDFLNSLINCSKLEYLGLRVNNFGGNLPKAVGNLSHQLMRLELNSNNIHGSIPAEITSLRNLLSLDLRNNSLTDLHLPLCSTGGSKRVKKHVLKLRIIVICLVLFFFLLAASFAIFWIRKSKRKTSTFSAFEGLLQVSYRRILEATGGLSPNNLIGVGSFGSVYKGTFDSEERVVAVKVLNLQRKGATKSFLAECNALKRVKHRNLVKVLTCCSSVDYNGNDFKALVFEFMVNGSLEKWIHPEPGENHSLDFLQRLNVSIDVASALQYLHRECEQPIVHCDLKPSNVLLDSALVAHVSDFGLARLLSTSNQVSEGKSSTIGLKGSVGYAAPEYGIGGEASKEGDVYSFGILLLEIFTGKRPTEEMFMDDFNLHSYVKVALAEKLLQVIDPILALEGIEEQNGETSSYQTQLSRNIQKCILSVLEVGLTCSKESPEERMKIEDATRRLQMIKRTFLLE